MKREHDRAKQRTCRLGSLAGGALGFTLAELLIAIGILGVGLAMAAALFPAGAKANKDSADDVLGTIVCENGLAIAMRKLETVHVPPNGGNFSDVTTWVDPSDLEYPAGGGDDVGYFVVARQVKPPANDYQLVVISYRKHPDGGRVMLGVVNGEQGASGKEFKITGGDVQVGSAVVIKGPPESGGGDGSAWVSLDNSNLGAGYARYGPWQPKTAPLTAAHLGTYDQLQPLPPGGLGFWAAWTFSVTSGSCYEINMSFGQRAGGVPAAPFLVNDVPAGTVNQQTANPGVLTWGTIGTCGPIVGDTLKVTLTDGCMTSGLTLADCVRIREVAGADAGDVNPAVGTYAIIESLGESPDGILATLDRAMPFSEAVSAFVVYQKKDPNDNDAETPGAPMSGSPVMSVMSIRTPLKRTPLQ